MSPTREARAAALLAEESRHRKDLTTNDDDDDGGGIILAGMLIPLSFGIVWMAAWYNEWWPRSLTQDSSSNSKPSRQSTSKKRNTAKEKRKLRAGAERVSTEELPPDV